MSLVEEKIVVITGVSGGIGRATAAGFAQAGWTVVGLDVNEPGQEVCGRFIECDLSEPAQIRAAVDSIAAVEGHLNALVNNAAVQVCKAGSDTTLAEWEQVLAVNVTAPFLLAKHTLPLLREAKAGCIVNVSSVHARATSPKIAAYATSKGALVSMTRALALELAEEQIRVNAVLPGAVNTAMLQEGLSRSRQEGVQPADQHAQFADQHPLRRVGQPSEIAQAILFLADHQRSSYITGECLVVDGGVTARLSTE